MTWLAWRQQRATVVTIAALLMLCAITVLILEIRTSGLVEATQGEPEFFAGYRDAFGAANGLIFVLPVLLGAFVGAPLFAREREQRTHVLALTQSVSRTRWLTTKTAMAAGSALAATGLYQALYLWWAFSLRPLEPRDFTTDARSFLDATGPVPLAWTLFAVVLGAALGLLLGNALSAVVLTFGVVLGLSYADRALLRVNVGHDPGWGGGRWQTLWPSPWVEAGTLVLAAAAIIATMLWWLRSRLVTA
ncbi:hypothetical protein FKR81_10290 [Lentzea tibetensis]|uniref:ABC transporter permease n=1 Tax=Lentzea tibetensis TaxID=2591470 RepID=A0A563EYD3_9PSEU|nr:hypothetical protein [Lentzea tibetensis]TWP52679.1 hypothetical protein FKR81_10290 [Lentzea tibetensis]